MFVLEPTYEEVVSHRVKPKKKCPRLVVDIDIPMQGNFVLHDDLRHKHAGHHRLANYNHTDHLRHADHGKHVRFHEHADADVAVPLLSPIHPPLTPRPRTPKDLAPKPINHHNRPAKPFCPDPPQCAIRHCPGPRIAGSHYCRNDTCRDPSCPRRSCAWGGFCDEHGCAMTKCRRRRAIIAVSERRGVERFVVSGFCSVHSCREGCGRAGEIEGYCAKHYERLCY